VVYDMLARCGGGRVVVLAATHSYLHGGELSGWREHDAAAPYRVVRRRLLRNRLREGPAPTGLKKLGARLSDLAMRTLTAVSILRLSLAEGVRTICVGELVAGGWILTLLRFAPGVRTVAYVHGEEITTEEGWDPGRRRVRRALAAANQVVVVSRFAEQAVAELMGRRGARKVTLISNGVDGRRFSPQPRRADLVQRFGLEGCFVFVSVCRLLEKKGVDNAIRAFARIAPMHPDSRFLVVGAGPFAADLRELARACGLGDKVVFAGEAPVHELAAYFGLGDVFVMPNRALANGDTEGFGLVFLEANACGLPVIAGRDGGSLDAVEEGVNGLTVNGRSVEEIAASMLILREDAELRARLRKGGLARAAASDWTFRAERFLEVCGLAPRERR
jgi:phosphatidylinositol alpha-1,6-mannosyltransferase